MTGVQSDTQFTSSLCSFDKRSDSCFRILRIVRRIRFSIQFDAIRPCFCRIFHHFRIGCHKNGSTNAGTVKLIENFRQEFLICFRIPTGIGSNLWRIVGNQSYLMRFNFQHQVNKFRRRITFNIKFSPQQRTQIIYIRTTNVTLVRTGMNGDTISPKRFTIKRYLYYIGHISPASIS